MDSIPIIVSTVLLAILVPSVAYLFIHTPDKQDFVNHAQNDEANLREIRSSIDRLSTKIDNKFDVIMTIMQNGNGK